jgi:hypothetical protein
MPLSIVRTTLAAAALSACTAQPPTTPGSDSTPQTSQRPLETRPDAVAGAATPDPPTVAWVDAGGGLSVHLDVPPGPHRVGDTLELGLEFRNDGQDELRIYLIDTPVFRALQSDLAVLTADGKFLDSQPEPHPHGYVVSERDFPAISPGTTRRFTQPLRLAPDSLGSTAGDLQVRWTYRNKISSWSGGVQTLDGPTKSLFGGGPIPGIWLGEISTTAALPVAR